MTMRQKSLRSIGPTFADIETSEQSMPTPLFHAFPPSEKARAGSANNRKWKKIMEIYNMPTSSAVASRVRTSPTPERGRASRANARDSGRSSSESLARFDPATSSWRTWQLSLTGGSTLFSATLPKSGMMRNGTLYRLPRLELRTGARESLLLLGTPRATQAIRSHAFRKGRLPSPEEFVQNWPTPTVADTFTDKLKSSQTKDGSMHSVTLGHAVQMWPTPCAMDMAERMGKLREDKKGGCLPNLPTMVKLREQSEVPYTKKGMRAAMFPTPNTRDWKGGISKQSMEGKICKSGKYFKAGPTLPNVVEKQGSNGQLNPTWVEWLMGFPLGWTASSASETQSCRRSRKPSDA